MDYRNQLSALKRKLAANQTSLLIGSGFSKNVSWKFPTWDELLHDLVVELHGEAIESEFAVHIRDTVKRDRLRHSLFVKNKASQILRRDGYLKVVSEYIGRKGYGEAIAAYIEERTPFIRRDGDDIILTTGGYSEKIVPERLVLHRAVIDLPWNNIYTTNYDELLDFCVQPTAIEDLQHTIVVINGEIQALNEREAELREELEKLPLTAPQENKEAATTIGLAEHLSFETNKTDEKTTAQKRYDINVELGNIRKRKDEKEQQVRNLEHSITNTYQVITRAAGLKLRRNKNIVKLHGSLRTADERKSNHFEFDSDHRNQYVISAEDYEQYPQKHEAFTQLMRISLLQESFCLIGFSGVDPNFLAWIGWVRDILQKQARENFNTEEYKIYLIDVQTDADTPARQLFYQNHSIIRIPLRLPEILNIIAPGYGAGSTVTPTEAIGFFLKYLSADEQLTPFIPVKDLAAEQDIKAAWRDYRFFDFDKKTDIEKVKKTVETLDPLDGKVFLPDVNHAYSSNQHSLINAASTQLLMFAGSEPDTEWLCRLVFHAVKNYMVPITNAIEPEVIAAMMKYPSLKDVTEKLLIRAESIRDPGQPVKGEDYDEILRLAYEMRFTELHTKLEGWQSRGKEVIRKAGFLAIFDPSAAENILQHELENADDLNGEETLYAQELISYFKMSESWSRDKKIDKIVAQYEHSGFRKLADNFEYLQDRLSPKPEKILPYGKGRFSTGNTVQFVSNSDAEMASQYLMLLAESGVQMAIPKVTYRSSENFYPVFKSGFEIYPFAFLYYALQYGGEDFLQRVGQDYAFSEKLADRLPQLVANLFRCQFEGPEFMSYHTYYLLSELLNAVEPDFWEADFITSWQRSVEKGIPFRDRHDPEIPFFTAGIKYIKRQESMVVIVEDCLKSILDNALDMGINYLYYLNFNRYFKLNTRQKGNWVSLEPILDRMIVDLPGNVDRHLFALGNLYPLLNTNQIKLIRETLTREDFTKVKNPRIWHIILYFLQGEKIAVKAFRQAVVNHPKLWYTGINGKSISGGVESIDLSKLTKSPDNRKGVIWSASEQKALFDKILNVLPLINSVSDLRSGFHSFTDVLEDMIIFLLNHENKLKIRKDYNETLELARTLLAQERQFDSTVQGIASSDNSPVIYALHEMNRQLRTRSLAPETLITLLSKAMLQHQPGLEATLDFLSIWLDVKEQEGQLKIHTPYLLNILRRYLDEMPADINIPFVQQRLISMAFTLKRWGITGDPVDKWLTLAQSSIFNNVKQLLLKKSKKLAD